ncbi:helix-turn-helix domain-containing protein [Streptomyces parvulus]|uniref:helix-turn-helix domain-containing protein n=1 Tax=Streptomyces parvulus TaxID=146923 RepID=UPI003EC051BB
MADGAVDAGVVGGGGEPDVSDSLRTFGAVVQGFRKRAGMTQEELAERVRYSVQTVASVEQGRRFPTAEYVRRAEDVLDAAGILSGAVRYLSRQPGLASWFRQWAGLEATAISLSTYECRLVPGLLQTEAYARTLFENQLPPLSDEQIEARWVARTERQKLLRERPNTAFSFIVEEHLFLRRTGGADATRQLIDHVMELAALRNVEVQVMPLVRAAHAGLAGPMQLLETSEARWFAYNEGQRGGLFVSDPKEVSVLQMRYARMRSQALSLEDSLGLLQEMRGAR